MQKNIRYSVRAGEEQEKLYDYLLEKFGKTTVKEIDQIIESTKRDLTKMPFIGKAVDKNAYLRYVVIKKKLRIYYRIKLNYIEIASFRDVRLNPKNINLK
jgi:plasmid stabilization system protein ParE